MLIYIHVNTYNSYINDIYARAFINLYLFVFLMALKFVFNFVRRVIRLNYFELFSFLYILARAKTGNKLPVYFAGQAVHSSRKRLYST